MDEPFLARGFSKNDVILKNERLDERLSMGTFFITKKPNKLLRGNACLQLFVTNKRLARVSPMKSKSEVMIAL